MLKNFKLVNTEGLGSINYDGIDYSIRDIDNDALAAKLFGKTHIIEKVAAEVAAEPATADEADSSVPATTRRRAS